jgi:folate-binding protein YgfZ
MAGAFVTELADRGVVRVHGPDAVPFLQGLVTSDVAHLEQGGAGYAALLTPQGKILFDFLLVRTAEGFVLDAPKAEVEGLAKRLAFYRLRAKVAIADETHAETVVAFWGAASPPIVAGAVFRDPRLPALGFRAIVPRGQVAGAVSGFGLTRTDAAAYHAHRVALGVPEGGRDFAFGEAFPHDADMDALKGVDFGKGCYVGQEVVSRMQHRGTARRRIVRVSAAAPLPPPGTTITAAERPVGSLGSVAGRDGLALVRLDRVKAAVDAGTPLVADGVEIVAVIPEWAPFGWPEGPAEEG